MRVGRALLADADYTGLNRRVAESPEKGETEQSVLSRVRLLVGLTAANARAMRWPDKPTTQPIGANGSDAQNNYSPLRSPRLCGSIRSSPGVSAEKPPARG